MIVSVTQSLVPPIGTAAAVMFGVAELPDHFTTMGGFLMVTGIVLIAKASASQEIHVDLNPNPSAETFAEKIV